MFPVFFVAVEANLTHCSFFTLTAASCLSTLAGLRKSASKSLQKTVSQSSCPCPVLARQALARVRVRACGGSKICRGRQKIQKI